MARLPQISFNRATFDARARADLEQIKSDTAADVDAYEQGCNKGQLQCVAVFYQGERVGTLIVSWINEDVLVFVCNAARVEVIDGQRMTLLIYDLCAAWAASQGAERIRFWTARPGLAAATEAVGFSKMFVMEKEI